MLPFGELAGPASLFAGLFCPQGNLTVIAVLFAPAHRGKCRLPITPSAKAQEDGFTGSVVLCNTDQVKEPHAVTAHTEHPLGLEAGG